MTNNTIENIIVSPSGKLYGSENVLFDFLEGSLNAYKIYVPKNSIFYEKLNNASYNVKGYRNLKWLYFKIFLQLLFYRKGLLLNEGGHISYIKLLAKLLPKNKFVAVIRLTEDCNSKLNKLTNNITLIAVSNFIKNKINSNLSPVVVYDPYKITLTQNNSNYFERIKKNKVIKLGVIGRVTASKGGDNLIEILKYLSEEEIKLLEIHFFGSYDVNEKWFIDFKLKLDNVKGLNYNLRGFCSEKEEIYKSIDVLIHLNKQEPLGRILFESIDYCLPAFVYKSGGIGELAIELGLSQMAMSDSLQYANELKRLIKERHLNNFDLSASKEIIFNNFNAKSYSIALEKHL